MFSAKRLKVIAGITGLVVGLVASVAIAAEAVEGPPPEDPLTTVESAPASVLAESSPGPDALVGAVEPADMAVPMPGWDPAPADGCVPVRPAFSDLRPGGAETYAIFDAVFLQRDNQSVGRPLVVSGPGGPPALSSDALAFNVQPGVRLVYGRARDCDPGWELGYLGVWGMFAEDNAASRTGALEAAGPLGLQSGVLRNAEYVRATYRSSLNSAEINLFRRLCDGGPDRLAGEPWRRAGDYDRGTFDCLVGFRWAGLDESSVLAFSPAGNRGAGLYGVASNSNIFAGQVGARGRLAWNHWAVESRAKVGLGGTAMSQSQQPIFNSVVTAGGEPLLERPARSALEGGVGFIGEMNFTLVRRLNDTWGLRVGYNMLWLAGVALAPNQFDFSAPPAGGTGLNAGSGVSLYGGSVGLEGRW